MSTCHIWCCYWVSTTVCWSPGHQWQQSEGWACSCISSAAIHCCPSFNTRWASSICVFLLQLSITGTQFLIFDDSLPFPQIWSVKFYCFTCSTSSSPNSSTICLSSCYDHCSPTAWAARQQPCLSGEISPHFVLTYHWVAHNNTCCVNISLYHCVIALLLHTDLCGSISAAACWSSLPCTNCPIHG